MGGVKWTAQYKLKLFDHKMMWLKYKNIKLWVYDANHSSEC